MSRALRPLSDRLLKSWGLSIGSSFRACSSLLGSQSVAETPSVVLSPAWAERMEVREEFFSDMELMAVPKRKVTPSRRGKRNNGNWKLKSVPVIAKCKFVRYERREHEHQFLRQRGVSPFRATLPHEFANF